MITLHCWEKFSCTAEKCSHSCCKGWEIDIDNPTLRRYGTVEGELGQELRKSIMIDDAGASFVLQGEEERCPFLNQQGLCRIILELGEDYLSEICTQHPRFYHICNQQEEMGFGLCCEESTRLLLGESAPLRLSGDWAWREKLIKRAQKRSVPLEKRLSSLATLPKRDWKKLYLSLERMDESWSSALENWNGELSPVPTVLSIPLENLLVYFLFRHWTQKGDKAGIAFSVLSVRLLASLHGQGCGTLRELSRLYSSEIEYSDVNTDTIKALLKER